MGFRLATTQEQIRIPFKRVIRTLCVQRRFPTRLEGSALLRRYVLGAPLRATSARIRHLISLRKLTQHGEIKIEGIGKENTFLLKSPGPIIFRLSRTKLLVSKLIDFIRIYIAEKVLSVTAKIIPDIGQAFQTSFYGVYPTMPAPQIKIEQCCMWNLQIIKQPPEMRYETAS